MEPINERFAKEHALNRQVAEALGYTVRLEKGDEWCLYSPDGIFIRRTSHSEDAVFSNATFFGDIDDYANDATAAHDLWIEHKPDSCYAYQCTFLQEPGNLSVYVFASLEDMYNGEKHCVATGQYEKESPASIIARGWLDEMQNYS